MPVKTKKINKSRFADTSGITVVEILVIVALITILASGAILMLNPSQTYARARDNKRLSDLSTLDRAINEYKIDNDVYPSEINTTRLSTLVPVGSATPSENPTGGWIFADLSPYLSKLPLDPLNDSNYYYSYRNNGVSYEINARLEYLTEELTNDGGNSDLIYEIGDDLSIL